MAIPNIKEIVQVTAVASISLFLPKHGLILDALGTHITIRKMPRTNETAPLMA